MTDTLTSMRTATLSRKRFIISGLAAAGGVILARSLFGRRTIEASQGENWYEVVQDMYKPGTWHINLYRGPTLGDLSQGTLVKRWVDHNTSFPAVQRVLEYPWRVQYNAGPQEKSF